jgi:O-acetyl-ADP-ribose deacetylase (regulator of RNase III)
VGPVYRDGKHEEPATLARCYRRCLELAAEHGVKRVAFPAISTGVYGYPLKEAAEIALKEVADFLGRPDCAVERATFELFGARALQAFETAAEKILPGAFQGLY